MKIHFDDSSLAVHTWWHSWNHYGMFGLNDEHSTLLAVHEEGYVPLAVKHLYLSAVFDLDSQEYVAAVKAMYKRELAWALAQDKEDYDG